MDLQDARLMAEYNRWMNARMYEAAAGLDAAQVAADRGAFFGSILGTFNHIAAGDTIWLHRLVPGRAAAGFLAELSAFARPAALRQPMGEDLAALRAYRYRLDAFIERWVAELTPAHLAGKISYASMAGVVSTRDFGSVLLHFFNHQTHHRGQASTLLFQAGVDVGVTDLLAIIPQRDA